VNLGQLRTAVLDRLGLPSDDPIITTTVLDRDINSRLHYIASQRDWHWLVTTATFNTVVGQRAYTPPADWLRTLHIYDDGRQLDARQPQNLPVPPADTPNNRSVAYAVEGGSLLLWPTPEAVRPLTHIYVRDETDLALTTDTPLIPAGYHDYLVTLAAILGAIRIDNEKREAALRTEAQDWLRTINDNARKLVVPVRPRKVRPHLWGGGQSWRSR